METRAVCHGHCARIALTCDIYTQITENRFRFRPDTTDQAFPVQMIRTRTVSDTQTHTKTTQTDPMRLCAKRVLARLTWSIWTRVSMSLRVPGPSESGLACLLIPMIAVLVTHASAPTPFTPVETRRAQPVYPRPWMRSRLLCGDVHALRRVGGAWEARASGSWVTSDF